MLFFEIDCIFETTGPPAPLIDVSQGGHFFYGNKKATTYREQVEKIKQRGCCIEDVDVAVRCLESINYYRLSAYFLPFRNADGSYNAGTSFSRIVQIYEFDRLLRRSLFSALEEIEISMRARLAYFLKGRDTKWGKQSFKPVKSRSKY